MEKTIDRVAASQLGHGRFNFKYYFRNKPVVITDGASQWRATNVWSPSYLRSLFPDREVFLVHHRQGIFDYNDNAATGKAEVLKTSFDKAVDLILTESGNVHYLAQTNIMGVFPELLPDMQRPYLLSRVKRALETNIWFGAKGCKTPLHYDYDKENFLVQIMGRKRVTLFSPRDSEFLYPAIGDSHPHCSRVNVFSPDMSAFPLYERAKSRQLLFEIGPGNILYIPQGWWHAIESLDVSISINTWWINIARLFVKYTLPKLFSREPYLDMWKSE
jgi:hypothetical protein